MSDVEEANFYANALCDPCKMKFILDDFTIQNPMTHETLRRYIEKYPGLAEQLCDVFHQCQMADLEAAANSK